MSILRGMILLLIVGAVFTALLNMIVPHSVSTPGRAMESTIKMYDQKLAKDQESTGDEEVYRRNMDGGPRTAASPLELIITGRGLPCDGILGAEVVPSGDGAFWITCRTQTGTARYRVDTRLNLAEPV